MGDIIKKFELYLYGKLLYQNSDKFEEDVKAHGRMSILLFALMVPFVVIVSYFILYLDSIIGIMIIVLTAVLILALIVVAYRYKNRLRFQIYEMGIVMSSPMIPFVKFSEIERLYLLKNFREGHPAFIILMKNNKRYIIEARARPNVVEQVENFQEAFNIIKKQLMYVHKSKSEQELVKYIKTVFEIDKVEKPEI